VPPKTTALPRKRKILLVDDHGVFRDALTLLLERDGAFSVCGSFSDPAKALREAPRLKPDLYLLEIAFDGMSGLELTKALRTRFPSSRILILSMHKEFLYAERALRAGANGYISKQRSGREVVESVRRVLQGETWLSEAVKERLLESIGRHDRHPGASPVSRLSDRELEIFQLIARGYGTRHLAARLHLSPKTVETHRDHIREKLGMKSSFELVQYAHAWAVTES
jgi:DNA-binding NarL/FixJ family response regulator